MAVLATMLATVGEFVAGLGSQASLWIIFDEPNCPKSLIK